MNYAEGYNAASVETYIGAQFEIAKNLLRLSLLDDEQVADVSDLTMGRIEILKAEIAMQQDDLPWYKNWLASKFAADAVDGKTPESTPKGLDLDRERREWRQEGMEDGIREGRQRIQRKVVENLLRLDLLTDQQIAEVTDLPIGTIQTLKAENRH